jgi:hypothetical protein
MHPTDFIMVLLLGAGVWRLIRVGRRVIAGRPGGARRRARQAAGVGGRPAGRRAGRVGPGDGRRVDQIDGRAERWRFAAGCVSAALLLPPWGRAGAVVVAFIAAAAGAAGLFACAVILYPGGGSGVGIWLFLAFFLAILAGYILTGSVLVRRPGVAGPGLVGGLVIAAPWLALAGVTDHPVASPLVPLLWLAVVPLAVGAAGTWHGGTAAFGRRTALLAGLSAALGLFLIRVGVLAATGGGPYTPSQIREAGGTDVTSYFVGDGLGKATMLLLLMPLLTATIGWAGAALAARIRRA